MTDPMKKTWGEVGESFEALGRLLKGRYQAPGAERAPAAHEEGAALREAFDKLVSAAKDFGVRATDVVQDPDVKEQTKQVARNLNAALSATVDEIGEEVGGLFKRKGSEAPEQGPEDQGKSS